MPTPTEKTLTARKRAAESGGILVPILERLLEHEVIPESETHFRYMDMLVRARAIPRRKGVFSPSMLGSCMRQAWLAKRGTEKHLTQSAQTNGYFLKGNFVHLQWQFALWQAHEQGLLKLMPTPIEHEVEIINDLPISKEDRNAWIRALDFYGDGTRPGVEVRIVDDELDFGGTIDVLAEILANRYVIDVKGINLIDFQKTIKNGAKQEYRKQIVGYAGVANKVWKLGIEKCLLLSECKAGPLPGRGSPLALHETLVDVREFEGEVKRRLKTLLFADQTDAMPAIECVSTAHMRYQECPFGGRFCHDEVLPVQRAREAEARARHAATVRDAKPARSSG